MYEILLENGETLKKKFFKHSLELIPLIIFSVDITTIRSFRKINGIVSKYKPLSIYRTWAESFLSNTETRIRIREKGDFSVFRQYTLDNLIKYWEENDGGKPKFHHFNKLVDLTLKCLPIWKVLPEDEKDWIFENANVPLDKHSLGELRGRTKNIIIPKNASMNFITENNYNDIQKEIKNLCINIPVLIFDLYAWDKAHKPPTSFKLEKLDFN